MHYYNDNDPGSVRWLRALIGAGLLPEGEVDDRSIADVRANELLGYDQCHFFAGIGGWPYALSLAGWPAGRPVWTGSCPCQPFSVAGSGGGEDDPRHLWPEFRRLIAECRPPVVFGEQVASKAGRGWLSGVRLDLEALGYGVGAADLCAPGAGAPHIRQRLFWVADANRKRRHGIDPLLREGGGRGGEPEKVSEAAGSGSTGGVADAEHDRAGHISGTIADQGRGGVDAWAKSLRQGNRESLPGGVDSRSKSRSGGVADSQVAEGGSGKAVPGSGPEQRSSRLRETGFWSDYDLVPCRDGKVRRVKSGLHPLAHGVPARVVQLRGLGNAIVPQVAQIFIESYLQI